MIKLKKMNSKYIVVILLVILGLTTVFINTSFGLFRKQDVLTDINFITGTLNYKIENNNLENGSILVKSGEEYKLILSLTSLNAIDSKYELYYLIDGEKVTDENIEIGYKIDTKDSVKGTITSNGTKQITVSIKNNSSKSVTITLGCEGGLINNTLVMTKGNSLDMLISDDIMLAYTYIGTGTKPSKFPSKDDGYYISNLTCAGGTAEWDNATWTMKVTSTTASSINCTATIVDVYKDSSGAAIPVLAGDLVPAIISDTGVVTKANLYEKWYDYSNSNWANAVILNDNYGPYNDGATIPEEAIESYFVWIPRYRYKIFDEGNYTALGTKEAAEQTIEIEFETKDAKLSTGSTVGTWLTHPAFTSFDSNGMWVGKFESGYLGATAKTSAQVNSTDSSKLIIKPNVYSWRSITVGNAFKVSYDYNRDLDSHMMKNTEWGAVAYLSHSKYGKIGSLRLNNNSSYITGYSATEEPTKGYVTSSTSGNRVESTAPGVDGTYTVNYLNISSVVSSTTGNYSGIYDMSGGAWEYIMGYTTGASTVGGSSGIKTNYSDFFTNTNWNKYYDTYTSATNTSWNDRILGDAVGEMGPFFSEKDSDGDTRYKSSWYGDVAYFITSTNPWVNRGCYYLAGTASGAFAFGRNSGGVNADISFRVVMIP